MKVIRTDDEIERVEAWAMEGQEQVAGSRYSCMTYEDGMLEILQWLRGDIDAAPDGED
jgi:hypothetical protein